mmetsp:Transcript_36880/g.86810  ORF Transcript_36880/g.86810 Transcript_36880/m.86810 type:complete len:238 (-) Transcript_36880:738-1451(-)
MGVRPFSCTTSELLLARVTHRTTELLSQFLSSLAVSVVHQQLCQITIVLRQPVVDRSLARERDHRVPHDLHLVRVRLPLCDLLRLLLLHLLLPLRPRRLRFLLRALHAPFSLRPLFDLPVVGPLGGVAWDLRIEALLEALIVVAVAHAHDDVCHERLPLPLVLVLRRLAELFSSVGRHLHRYLAHRALQVTLPAMHLHLQLLVEHFLWSKSFEFEELVDRASAVPFFQKLLHLRSRI